MTKSRKTTRRKPGKIDVRKLLAKSREIAIIWGTEDVKHVRPDLSDDQAWHVLIECERCHDCEAGFTWALIEDVAESLFPSSTDE